MLRYATRKARELSVTTVHFERASFLTYECGTDSVDFVVTKFALHHLPDFWKVAALRRIWRWLKPGGTFYLRDVVFSFAPDDQADELERWIKTASETGSFSRADFEMHIRDEYSTYGILMEDMLRLAGFHKITAEYFSKVQAEYVCQKD